MNSHVMVARKERGLSQTALGQKAKVYRWAIGLIETGDWVPPKSVRMRIAKVLHSSEDALFGEALRRITA